METKPQRPNIFGPLDHHEYRVDLECECYLCEDWRRNRDSYFVLRTGNSHLLDCRCDPCRDRYRARTDYIAALNKRDLYCEASFHAWKNPAWGSLFMNWVTSQVTMYTSGFWEQRAPHRAMRDWLCAFDDDYFKSTGGVSGIVNI